MKPRLLQHYWKVCVLLAGPLLVSVVSTARADSTLTDTFSRATVPTFDLGVSEDTNHYAWTAVGDAAFASSIIDDGQPGNPYLFMDSGFVHYGVCPEAFIAADFDITWDFKISTGSEAGIFYRAPVPGQYTHGDPWYTALIHNGANGPFLYEAGNNLTAHGGTGLNFQQWQRCRVKVVGNHHQFWIGNIADSDTPWINYTADPSLPQGAGYLSLGRGYSSGSSQSYDNVVIKNLDQYGAVSGTITNQATSAAISGVKLSIDKLPAKTDTTGGAGTYNLTGVRYGSQTLQALQDNYYPVVTALTVPIGSTLTYNFQMKPLGAPAATIFDNFGRTSASLGVTEDALHVPWFDVNTAYPGRVQNPSMVFDTAGQGQGAALLQTFSPANFDMTATIATDRIFICYRSASQDGLDALGYRVYLDSRRVTPYLTDYVELWHNNTVLLHVELPDGLTWSGGVPVHIRVVGAHHQVWVNGVNYVDYVDGSSTAKNGPGVIAITKSGAANIGLKISALKIDAWDVAIPAEVSGQVKDSGGQPIQGAEVAFVAGLGFASTTTGADGKYKLANIVPSPGVTIQASKPGYDAVYVTTDIGNGARLTQDFTLAALPAGVIYDTFTRPDGRPIGSTEDSSHTHWLQGDPTTDHENLLNHRVWMPQPYYAGIGLDGVIASDVEVTADCLVSAVSAYGFGIMIRQHTGTPGKPVDWDILADGFNYAGNYISDMVNDSGIKYIGGVYTGPAKPTDWTKPHRFHVRVEGNKVNATVDGIPWITDAVTPSVGPGYISILRRGGECWVDNVVIQILDTPVANPGAAKALADGSKVSVQSAVVTGVFDGFFYIEAVGRGSGIKVISSATVNLDDQVAVSGIISTDANGERILTGSPFVIGPATPIVALNMNGRSVIQATGLPAAGLLATTWGKVSSLGSGSFYVNDGSSDTGIKVIVPTGVTLPGNLINGSHVVVTGCVGKDAGPVSALRLRTISDLTIE